MNAIEIRNLSKSFRGIYAVDYVISKTLEGFVCGVLCLVTISDSVLKKTSLV